MAFEWGTLKSLSAQAIDGTAPGQSGDEHMTDSILENPFESGDSKVLFDAIDQLQSCGASQDVEIPQLVIVGGQSTGKSSLLQSLTDIPFPIGTGCCTRFATRIVSKRTAPNTPNMFHISIVEPDIKFEGFDYPEDDSYKKYQHSGTNLTAEEFRNVMEDVSKNYMGIKEGRGYNKKNFATQVLRIELSGPTRSHFSIVDIPGIFSNPQSVNVEEMHAVKSMVLGYMRKEGNIVICVADATSDLAMQEIAALAVLHVNKSHLVGVFTKCDMVGNAEQVVSIATSRDDPSGQSMKDGWFVVRNRSDKEDKSFDLADAEAALFGKAPWDTIPSSRKGSTMLRLYLSNLLCARIRDNFSNIKNHLQKLLQENEACLRELGTPRISHQDRVQYLKDILSKYEDMARDVLERPRLLQGALKVTQKVHDENESFTETMQEDGHMYEFQHPDINPIELLRQLMEDREEAIEEKENQMAKPKQVQFVFGGVPPSPPGSAATTPTPTPKKAKSKSATTTRIQDEQGSELFDEIRAAVKSTRTLGLPGMPSPDVVQAVFHRQTAKWASIAEAHLDRIATHVEQASTAILTAVCPSTAGRNVLADGLFKAAAVLWQGSCEKTLVELQTLCYRERHSSLTTTDVSYEVDLRAWQTIRLMESMDPLGPDREINAFFNAVHFSSGDNMVKYYHDSLKVYYQIALKSFVRQITHHIVQNFVSHPEGPLRGLNRKWLDTLSESDVEELAREDDKTEAERARYNATIARLQTAYKIVSDADMQTKHLRDL